MMLLDTHIWIRWLCNDLPGLLSGKIVRAHSVSVSVISCWEVAYLAKRGRVELGLPVVEWLEASLAKSGISAIPLDLETARIAAGLPDHHRDPADRFIIATAIRHGARLVSFDSQFAAYTELKGRLVSQ